MGDIDNFGDRLREQREEKTREESPNPLVAGGVIVGIGILAGLYWRMTLWGWGQAAVSWFQLHVK